jgi:hypothetical protein
LFGNHMFEEVKNHLKTLGHTAEKTTDDQWVFLHPYFVLVLYFVHSIGSLHFHNGETWTTSTMLQTSVFPMATSTWIYLRYIFEHYIKLKLWLTYFSWFW